MVNRIDLSRVDLNLLVLLELVLEERHVGKAAERLNLSSSAISHGLGRLRRLFNDPLFLRTPKGVVPTDRALELAGPIAEILSRTRSVIATAEPFDPGHPRAASPSALPTASRRCSWRRCRGPARPCPGIDISVRQILPPRGGTTARVWEPVFDDLDARLMDSR